MLSTIKRQNCNFTKLLPVYLIFLALIILMCQSLLFPISTTEANHEKQTDTTSTQIKDSGMEITKVSGEERQALMNMGSLNFESEEISTKTDSTSASAGSIARGTRTVNEIEDNDDPWDATPITSGEDNLVGSLSSKTDNDWFEIKLSVDFSGSPKYVHNFTISQNSLTGESDRNVQIMIYGVYDINQNLRTDWESEMIFMQAENYRIGGLSPPTMYIHAYHTNQYYILFRTDGAWANYDFDIFRSSIEPPPETNQKIEFPESISPSETNPKMDMVQIDTDPFDWFKVSTTISSNPKIIGHNFTLKMRVDDMLDLKGQTVGDKTIYFVTVAHVLIYHENHVVTIPQTYQFREHFKLSWHGYTKLSYKVEYSDIITLPTHLFKYTYIGIYVETYGIDPLYPEVKLYPFITNIKERTDGWCSFIIEEASTEKINRPDLSKVSVRSTTTNEIHGRTYDNYKYTVVYTQENNYVPFATQISVFTDEGEVREGMTKVTPGWVKDDVFKEGCKYEFIFPGELLGEGNHHVFQFHFKDKNAWAAGTIELGMSWHGPYISNNIRPYVRPTAPANLTLYEDDNTTFFDLNNIFEDVDLKEELNFTMTDPDLETEDMVWGKTYSDSILDVKIVNQTRLRIDLKPNAFGDSKILFNVSDKKHYYLDPTFEFSIKVLPVNDPPQVIEYFSSLVIEEDTIYTQINLLDHFDDPIDLDELTFRVENNRNINISINQDDPDAREYGDIILIPELNWFGIEYIYFYASDGIDEVSDYLKVVVKPENDVPVIIINETLELWQDQWANFTFNAFDIADNDTVLISHNLTELFPKLEKKPEQYGYSFDNDTGYLTLKPKNHMVGTHFWNVSAIDSKNALNFTHVTLIINNVNDPPVPSILFPDNGARYLATDKIAFRGKVYDPDKGLKGIETDPLVLTWYSTLHGVKKKIGSGANLEPQLYDEGTHTISLVVDDGEVIRNTSIVVHVFGINTDLDTDKDGIPDYWENLFNFNLNDPHDADDDSDKDTYSNWEEYKAQTDPRNPNVYPEKHIFRKSSEDEQLILTYFGIFILLIIVMAILILYLLIKSRRKKREEKKRKKEDEAKGYKGAPQAKTGPGIYKAPKIVCHNCGKSLEVMTLNRPVAVTCPDCGFRGAVY